MTPELQLLGYAVTGVVTLALGILGTLKVVAGRREREDVAGAPIIAAARCNAEEETSRTRERLDEVRADIRADVQDAKAKTLHETRNIRQTVDLVVPILTQLASDHKRSADALDKIAESLARHAEEGDRRWRRNWDEHGEILRRIGANGRDHG